MTPLNYTHKTTCVQRIEERKSIVGKEKLGFNQNLRPPLRLKVDKTLKHLNVEIRNHVYQLQLVEPHIFLNLQAQTAAPNNAYQFSRSAVGTAVTRVLLYTVEECCFLRLSDLPPFMYAEYLAERKCCFGWFRDTEGEFCPFQTLLWGIEHFSPPHYHAC